jgi:hypothetical protein
MLTFLATAAAVFALALLLLPAALLIGGVIVAGAIVGTIAMAAIPSLSSIAALLLIGWAIFKGASRRRLRSSALDIRSARPSSSRGGLRSSVIRFCTVDRDRRQ